MVSFRPVFLVFATGALLAAGQAGAATVYGKVNARDYPGWRAELQHLVDRGRSPVAHICVVVRGDTARPQDSVLLAWFREERHIQGFGRPGAGYPLDDTAMAGADDIDLDRDVVASARQIGGSTSRVTRASVDTIRLRCREQGMEIVLRKKRR